MTRYTLLHCCLAIADTSLAPAQRLVTKLHRRAVNSPLINWQFTKLKYRFKERTYGKTQTNGIKQATIVYVIVNNKQLKLLGLKCHHLMFQITSYWEQCRAGDVLFGHMVELPQVQPSVSFISLTFRNPASYIKDGHTATFNTPYVSYLFNKYTYWIFVNMLHTLHFFLFKMPFISKCYLFWFLYYSHFTYRVC
jgi:hypothetical protein